MFIVLCLQNHGIRNISPLVNAYELVAESRDDTPYLVLTGELLDVFCEYFEEIDRLTAPYCLSVTATW